ncbi:MAG: SdpI family protein [Oscillospiraceae bacterium]|nr:SdpI family protein [Oscillospiraceae bacterium]
MGKIKIRILIWIAALVPLIIVAAVYQSLPDQVIMQWQQNGAVRYDDKINLWWVAGMSPFLAALLMLVPKIDPRKKNYVKFRGFYDGLCLFIMLFMIAITALVIAENRNPGSVQISAVVMGACGLMFAFIGNMLPKFKSNYFAGFRTPWTLSSDEVWRKTHRIAGFMWFFGGLLIAVLSFFLREAETALITAFISVTLVITLVPLVMSFIWYQRFPRKDD